MKKYLVSVVIACGLFASSCTKDTTTTPSGPVTQKKELDISYGTDVRNKLDVYLPENRTNQTPFVILIHGGGWKEGDKADMRGIQDSLLKRNIASVSINYRYASTTVHYNDLMDDVAKAVQFCANKSSEWNIRSNKYIISGMSAGAHMSLLYGYKYDITNKIGGIVNACGPTDLTNTDMLNLATLIGQISVLNNIAGATYTMGQPVPSAFRDASPRFFIKNTPTLIIHGTADNVVPYAQAQVLDSDLTAANYTHRFVSIPGANHDLGVGNPATYKMILDEIANWANTYGK